jgi:hypothetical protein
LINVQEWCSLPVRPTPQLLYLHSIDCGTSIALTQVGERGRECAIRERVGSEWAVREELEDEIYYYEQSGTERTHWRSLIDWLEHAG